MADGPPLVLKAQFGDEVTRVDVAGDLDFTTVPALHDMLCVALDRHPGRLVVDLSRVRYLDCAAARVIAGAALALPGHRFAIGNPAPIVRRLLQLTGLTALIEEGHCGRERRAASQRNRTGLPALAGRRAGSQPGRPERSGTAAGAGLGTTHPVIFQPARAAAPAPPLPGRAGQWRPGPGAGARHGEQLSERVVLTRARMTVLLGSIRATAGRLAGTGDRVAATLARRAELQPQDADRLSALSAAAHELAVRSRHHAISAR